MAVEYNNTTLKWKIFRESDWYNSVGLYENYSPQQVTIKWRELGCLFPKSILEKYSDFFKEILESLTETHPVVVMLDIPFSTLNQILTFLLLGKVEFSPVHIPLFREWAKRLKLRGFYSPQVKSSQLTYRIRKK